MSKVVNERDDVSEDLAIRLSHVLGSTPQILAGYASQFEHMETVTKNDRLYGGMERVQTG